MERPTLLRRPESRLSLHPANKQVMLAGGTGGTKLFSSFLHHLQRREMVGRTTRSRVPITLMMMFCLCKCTSVDLPRVQQPLQKPCFHTFPLVYPVIRKGLKMAVTSTMRVISRIGTPGQSRSTLHSQYTQHLCRQECVGDKRERKRTADNQDT